MTSVVFADGEPIVVAPPLQSWQRFGLVWTGWDGSIWDLRDVRSGVFVTDEGLLGLLNPTWEIETSTSPARSGRRRLDARTLQRNVTLPIYLHNDDGSLEWQFLFRRFMRSFHPMKPGTLTVSTGLGPRSIELYLESDGGAALATDPVWAGRLRIPLTLTAEDPYWKGPAVVRSWENSTQTPFFNPDGNLSVSAGAQLDTAAISNDGDVSAWPIWTIFARTVDAVVSITVSGGEVETPTVDAGAELIIDTDPSVGTALLNGFDVSGAVDPWDPRPIPEGEITPIEISSTGDPRIQCEIVPRYFRAVG